MKSTTYAQKSGRRVIIRPGDSRYMLWFKLVSHLVASVLVLSTGLSGFIQAVVVLLLAIHLTRDIRSATGQHHALSFTAANDLLLLNEGKEWRKIRIVKSFVTGWLIVIKVSEVGSRASQELVYARDSVTPAQFRLIRKFINQQARNSYQ